MLYCYWIIVVRYFNSRRHTFLISCSLYNYHDNSRKKTCLCVCKIYVFVIFSARTVKQNTGSLDLWPVPQCSSSPLKAKLLIFKSLQMIEFRSNNKILTPPHVCVCFKSDTESFVSPVLCFFIIIVTQLFVFFMLIFTKYK